MRLINKLPTEGLGELEFVAFASCGATAAETLGGVASNSGAPDGIDVASAFGAHGKCLCRLSGQIYIRIDCCRGKVQFMLTARPRWAGRSFLKEIGWPRNWLTVGRQEDATAHC